MGEYTADSSSVLAVWTCGRFGLAIPLTAASPEGFLRRAAAMECGQKTEGLEKGRTESLGKKGSEQDTTCARVPILTGLDVM